MKSRIVIVGGGVIGLSLAYELSKREEKIVLIEKDRVGQKASKAGAGILIPGNFETAIHPLEKLEARSNQLHKQWADELLRETGIDNGYVPCGGLHVARTAGEVASLTGAELHWEQRQIEFETIESPSAVTKGVDLSRLKKAVYLPGEAQIRNPDHLSALKAACQKRGVEILEQCQSVEIKLISGSKNETASIDVDGRVIEADKFCIAAGPWSEELVNPFDVPLPTTPVRGQMVLFKLPTQLFAPIINEGSRYLVPRLDGHVLGGATVEEVGFDLAIDEVDIANLKRWAGELVPELNESTFVDAWAGLRPGTYDGFPYIGPIGRSQNTIIATGHFKAGLHLSTATAEIVADLIEGKTPEIDVEPFLPSRVKHHH